MKRVIAIIADMFEDLELMYPVLRMREANIQVTIAAKEAHKIYTGVKGYPCKSDGSFEELKSVTFDGVLIPGGFAPDKVRCIPEAIQIVREIHNANKPIAFICHGGQVPISAKILREKRVTGTKAIRDDLENAGAIWQDEPVVIDGNLISSRNPLDLPLFGKALVEALLV